ncbi:tetratricopeptide repeat protein [candidate division KSB1 bacterium]|nr:tetratricopeptide repeat protein [candidate division KSB1 bacterium]
MHLLHRVFYAWVCTTLFAAASIAADSADDWVNKGRKSENVQERITYFEYAVKENPEHRIGWYELGRAYNQAGQPNMAENALRRSLRLSPDNLDRNEKINLIRELTNAYQNQNKYADVISSTEYLLTIIKDSHEQAELYITIGEMYYKLEQYDKAVGAFNTAVKLEPMHMALLHNSIENAMQMQSVQNLYEGAKRNIEKENYQAAMQQLNEVMAINPSYQNVQELLNTCMMRMESRKAENKELLISITDDADTIEETTQAKPIEKVETKKTNAKSVQRTQKRNARTSKKVDSLFKLSEEMVEIDELEQAKDALLELQAMDPDYPNLPSKLSEVEISIEAEKELMRVNQIFQSATGAMKRKDWLTATINFEKVKVLQPNYVKNLDTLIAQAHYNLLMANQREMVIPDSLRSSMSQEHRDVYAIGLVLSMIFVPLMVAFFFSAEIRARIYLLQGNYYRACQLYESILRRHPEKTKVYVTLANIYLIKNRLDEQALRIYHSALQAELDMATKNKIAALVENQDSNEQSNASTGMKSIISALRSDIQKLGHDAENR